MALGARWKTLFAALIGMLTASLALLRKHGVTFEPY
jgi:hypothetical protein